MAEVDLVTQVGPIFDASEQVHANYSINEEEKEQDAADVAQCW